MVTAGYGKRRAFTADGETMECRRGRGVVVGTVD